MPRSVFSASTFGNALRSPGASSLGQTIGMMMSGGESPAFAKARDGEVTLQSKLAQALAAQQARQATADLSAAKAETERADLAARQPDVIRNNALVANGIPLDEASAVDSFLKSGALGGKYAPPVDGMGPVAPAPDWMGKLGGVARAISSVGNALTVGDKNTENIAKAGEIARDADLEQRVLSGQMTPMQLALAKYAGKGSAPYHFSEYGVGNNLTGQVDDTGAPAQRFGALRTEQTTTERKQGLASDASARNSLASAGQHSAQTRKINQDIEMGGKGVVQNTEQGLFMVDPRTGSARPIMGPDGKPLARPGGKEVSLNGEQANALTFATRMQAANDIFDQLARRGVTRPGAMKGGVEGIAGAVPIIGESLAGGAANAMNWTQSDAQQQVEQAQRDFINAVLRRESGAAISMGEFANAAKQYFPQIGDSRAVIEQKRMARKRVTDGMMQAVPNSRRPTAPPSGATGAWGAPEAPPGWSIQRIP